VITDAAALDPEVRRAFDNEVRSVARLEHRGIVQVYDYGTIDDQAAAGSQGRLASGSPYLAMEFLGGGTLDTAAVPSSWEALRVVLLDLLEALAHAHSRGLVHRDLTPGNILYPGDYGEAGGVVERRHPRITDFGIAHALSADEGDEDSESHSGTVLYMSPEQLHGRWRDHGPWTDLYAVGCIAWELATGRRAVDGDTVFSVVFARLHGDLAGFTPRLELPPRFEAWVTRLLERDPRDRFRSAADAAFALEELETSPVFGPPPLPASWRASSEHEATESGVSSRRPILDVGAGLLGLRSAPPLGRDVTLDTLWARLGEVWTDAGPRLVLLKGREGSGRSHIAEFFCQRAAAVGGASWQRVVHDSMPTARAGLSAMLAVVLGTRGLEGEARRDRVKDVLAREGVTDSWEVSSVLAVLAAERFHVATDDLPALRFSVPKERFMVVQRVLRRLATERPLIVVLDDLHWGSETLDFVAHLLDEPAAAVGPVLFVGSLDTELSEGMPWLSETVATLVKASSTTLIELPDLDHASCRRLAREQLGLCPELADEVAERSGGRPALTIATVTEWAKRGLLQRSSDGLVLSDPTAFDLTGMESVSVIRSSRTTRLLSDFGPDARGSLEVAAALGRQVDVFEWNHACGRAGLRADPGLIDALLSEGLALPAESGWFFRSEGVRADLERSARANGVWARWNDAAAQMIRQRFSRGGHGVAMRRASHLLQAGSAALGDAVAELGEAAWEYVDTNEFRPALVTTERREEALRELGAGPSDPRWGECMLVRCGVLVHLGDHLRGLDEARRAEVAACRYGWNNVLARALGQQAVIALESGDVEEASERWEEALRLCSPRDVQTRARLLWYLGEMHRKGGGFEAAVQLHERAVELFSSCGDSEGQGEAKLGLALVAYDQGQSELGQLRLDEAEALFVAAGIRSGLGTVAGVRASLALLAGDSVEATRQLRLSSDILESLGSGGVIESLIKLGDVCAAAGDFDGLDQALHRIERCGRPVARAAWEGHIAVGRLVLVAHRSDWSAWRTRMDAAQFEWERALATSDEFASLAQRAGDLAVAAGKGKQAHEAYMLAQGPGPSKGEMPAFTIVDGMLSRLPKLA